MVTPKVICLVSLIVIVQLFVRSLKYSVLQPIALVFLTFHSVILVKRFYLSSATVN